MALYITEKDGTEHLVYVGQKLPWAKSENMHKRPQLGDIELPVHSVQADGDELEWVMRNITGIPFNKGRVQLWHGDFAKFIYNSLPRG
jgi:hypothetical protein